MLCTHLNGLVMQSQSRPLGIWCPISMYFSYYAIRLKYVQGREFICWLLGFAAIVHYMRFAGRYFIVIVKVHNFARNNLGRSQLGSWRLKHARLFHLLYLCGFLKQDPFSSLSSPFVYLHTKSYKAKSTKDVASVAGRIACSCHLQ